MKHWKTTCRVCQQHGSTHSNTAHPTKRCNSAQGLPATLLNSKQHCPIDCNANRMTHDLCDMKIKMHCIQQNRIVSTVVGSQCRSGQLRTRLPNSQQPARAMHFIHSNTAHPMKRCNSAQGLPATLLISKQHCSTSRNANRMTHESCDMKIKMHCIQMTRL